MKSGRIAFQFVLLACLLFPFALVFLAADTGLRDDSLEPVEQRQLLLAADDEDEEDEEDEEEEEEEEEEDDDEEDEDDEEEDDQDEDDEDDEDEDDDEEDEDEDEEEDDEDEDEDDEDEDDEEDDEEDFEREERILDLFHAFSKTLEGNRLSLYYSFESMDKSQVADWTPRLRNFKRRLRWSLGESDEFAELKSVVVSKTGLWRHKAKFRGPISVTLDIQSKAGYRPGTFIGPVLFDPSTKESIGSNDGQQAIRLKGMKQSGRPVPATMKPIGRDRHTVAIRRRGTRMDIFRHGRDARISAGNLTKKFASTYQPGFAWGGGANCYVFGIEIEGQLDPAWLKEQLGSTEKASDEPKKKRRKSDPIARKFVRKNIDRYLGANEMDFLDGGRMSMSFDFTEKKLEQQTAFRPNIETHPTRLFRWSLSIEEFITLPNGADKREFIGLKIGNAGLVVLDCVFHDDVEAEMEVIQFTTYRARQALSLIFYDPKTRRGIGNNFGTQCVELAGGKITGRSGAVEDMPMKQRIKFKLVVRNGKFKVFRNGQLVTSADYDPEKLGRGRIGFHWKGAMSAIISYLHVQGAVDYDEMFKVIRDRPDD